MCQANPAASHMLAARVRSLCFHKSQARSVQCASTKASKTTAATLRCGVSMSRVSAGCCVMQEFSPQAPTDGTRIGTTLALLLSVLVTWAGHQSCALLASIRGDTRLFGLTRSCLARHISLSDCNTTCCILTCTESHMDNMRTHPA